MLAARNPASPRSLSLATSSPVTRTDPLEGRSRVPIRCSKVVFPDPDGPRIATSSPAPTARLTPVTAVTGGSLGYTFTTLSSSSTRPGPPPGRYPATGSAVAVLIAPPPRPRASPSRRSQGGDHDVLARGQVAGDLDHAVGIVEQPDCDLDQMVPAGPGDLHRIPAGPGHQRRDRHHQGIGHAAC